MSYGCDRALDIIKSVNADLQLNNLRYMILKELQKEFKANILTFFLADSKGRLLDPVLKDGDPKNTGKYLNHYNVFDPMNPKNLRTFGKPVLRLSEVVSYSKFTREEYYSDFMAPQPIHFGMYLYLSSLRRLKGRISIFRPRGSKNFCEEDVKMANLLVPHLTFAVENAKIHQKLVEGGKTLFQIIDECPLWGVLVLNNRLQPILVNQKAREFVILLKEKGIIFDDPPFLPKEVFQDCFEILKAAQKGEIIPLPKNRIIPFYTQDRFLFQSQVIHQDWGIKSEPTLMIFIDKVMGAKVDENNLHESYNLTKREVEIVGLIVEGLKNSKVADRLFISEVTVKKHIQNIFEKMRVNNRTSLVRKALCSEKGSPMPLDQP
jgi:DNA-binding CsgD family transcriptional regulator